MVFLIVLVPGGVRRVHETLQRRIGHGADLVLQRRTKSADRRDQPLPLGQRPAVADADGHRLGTLRGGQEPRIGGHLLVGSAGEVAVELQGLFRLRKGMQHQPRQYRADGMETVLERGDHAKVAPTATQPPEEVGIRGIADHPDLAVGGDEIDGEQVIAGQPVFVPQPAEATAQGEARNAGIGVGAPGGRQAERLGLAVKFAPLDSPLRAHRVSDRIDPNAFHQGQVDYQSTMADARASEAVRPTAHGYQQVVLTGEVDRLHDVGDPSGAGDQARPPVDIGVPDPAGLIIAVITRSDEWAA